MMQFDINKVPFSRYNSYLGISSRNKQGKLYVHCARRVFGEDKVFEILPLQHGKPAAVQTRFEPHVLHIIGSDGAAKLYLHGENGLVIESKGLDFQWRLAELPSKNGDVPEAYPLAYGSPEVDGHFKLISVNARLYISIQVFEGEGELTGPLIKNERGNYIDQRTHFTLHAGNQTALALIHISPHELLRQSFVKPAVTAHLKQIEIEWQQFYSKMPAVAEKYRYSATRSWYTLWASTVPAGGNYLYPAIVMSMEFMSSVFSWDHCFNALAAAEYDLQYGLNQFFLPFEQQAPNGALPDYMNPGLEVVWGVTKPPVHGWCFGKLMDKYEMDAAILQKAYTHLSLQTDWWMYYRDTDNDGIPDYPMGCDSGWDNATVFDLGYFVESPDLCAYLFLQMNTLARIAVKLNKEQEALQWDERANRLYAGLIEHSWVNNRFIARVSGSHHYDEEPGSLITLLPLVLGNLLDEEKRQYLLNELRQHYLTDYGLATEKYKSPYYRHDNYWRGAIWAPSTYLVVDGLMRAGEKTLGLTIAQRFCNMIAFTANGDFENFNALTGEGLRASGYTWTSAVNILLLKLLHENSYG